MSLAAGDTLGPYEILAKLGEGGMGDVWKARDPRLNRTVAVKRLKEPRGDRFVQEARTIAALNHPHICQIFDIGPDYLVLEYIEGRPLAGGVPADDAVQFATQIAQALDAAHRKGVVHRDLKPANIMVTSDGVIKLLDFGLAKQTDASGDALTIESTGVGTILGTVGYMAPEQAEGRTADARSDIFSFGVVLYELLSGRRPFTGANAVSTMAAIIRDEPAPLTASPALQAIVARCLAKSPLQRYQTAAELLDDLRTPSGVVPRPPSPAPSTPAIAVLPFANISAEADNEYFSDGLTEEVINFLTQIPGLKVTARTSAFAFKGKTADVRTIAGALGVTSILEGSVRRAGSRIRVTAQLINASDGCHIWSQRYDREIADLFDVQDELAHAIASSLRVALSSQPAVFMPYKPTLAAYEALLKARHYSGLLRPDMLRRAGEYFAQAVTLDPQFAQAHCEYGVHFMMMVVLGMVAPREGWAMVREQAQRALTLDPSLAEGEAMLATVAGSLDYDWDEGERRFRTASAGPSVPVHVRLYYALHLMKTGRPADAVRQADLGLEDDPLNMLLRINRASFLAGDGREDEAVRAYREVLDLNPSMVLAQFNIAGWHAFRGEWDEARRMCEAAYAVAPLPRVAGLLAGLLQRDRESNRASALLAQVHRAGDLGGPLGMALYHWVLRDYDQEADWLERSLEARDPIAAMLIRFWYGAELRATPRWSGLMKTLNLPSA